MSASKENKRLFIGIQLPQAVRDELREAQDKIAFKAAGRWVEADNMHLTLKFLGNRESSFIEPLSQKLQSIISNYHSFYLTTTVFGSFPSPSRARVLWFGLKDCDELVSMQNNIDTALTEFGYDQEKRKFHPHITLARFKKPAKIGVDELNNSLQINQQFKVDRVVLFESRPANHRVQYSSLKFFLLNG